MAMNTTTGGVQVQGQAVQVLQPVEDPYSSLYPRPETSSGSTGSSNGNGHDEQTVPRASVPFDGKTERISDMDLLGDVRDKVMESAGRMAKIQRMIRELKEEMHDDYSVAYVEE